ncbi:MAG: tetratricopeptide repeat protein, partial [Planctomycetales bacterium]
EVWEDAIAAYDRVIHEYAGCEWVKEARWSIAECTINLSRWRDAVENYRKFAAAYPKDAQATLASRRIEILKTLDRYQNVVDEEGQRKSFDAQFQIAKIVHDQLSNPVKSIIEYRKVATRWPQSHLADDALYQVGVTYLSLDETEKAREALLAAAENYPGSPLADDALFMVGQSYENEAQRFAAVTRDTSAKRANDLAQKFAYSKSQALRLESRGRNQTRVSQLRRQGKFDQADEQVATNAALNKYFDVANVQVISQWAMQEAEALTAAQLADRQDKVNAAFRKAVASFRRAASQVSGDKGDDALLRMAQIQDQRLKDADAAMETWLEIVKQFSGTSVAEDASWKIAQYYEKHAEHAKAIEAYQAFLRNYRRSPKASAAQAAVAENFEHLGKWVEAMDAYSNYLTNFPQGARITQAKEQISWIKTYRL